LKNTTQEWLPFEEITKDGIIKLKNNSYVKILKINPINFNLKSNFEKESILNSYKLFLKTCNFNIQILIQSNKENINKYIKKIKNNINNENNKIKNISEKYCEYIKKINYENKFSSKKFFILIKKDSQKENIEIIKEELNNNYLKIKECLARCGNKVYAVSSQEEIEEILYIFLNTKKYIENINN